MSQHLAAIRAQEINPGRLPELFRRQFEMSRIGAGQTIAVVSDLSTRREYVHAAFAAADALGADIYEMCVNNVPSWTKVGVPTIGQCKGTLEAVCAADVVVIFHVPLFTRWLKQAMDAGVRVLMIIDAPDDLEQLLSPPGLKDAVLHAHRRLAATREVRVTSPSGTDFRYHTGDYPVMSQYGIADEPGRFDHWGAGHVHTFPNEGTASGRVVIAPGDIVILPYCRYVTDAIELNVENGVITACEGGLDAKLMTDWLDSHRERPDDTDPWAISHLGWGLNPQALWHGLALHGDEPERMRAAARTFPGNFLFSTGPNTQGGGKRATRGHYDVPMRDCTVSLDNELIIKRGKLVDPAMIVPRVSR